MEKRLIAALVISVVFFVAYDKYVFQLYSEPEGTVAEQQAAATPKETEQPKDQPAQAAISKESAILSADKSLTLKKVGEGSLVKVNSPLYTAQISTKGVTLRSFLLKGYPFTNAEGQTTTLDLVKQNAKRHPLSTTFNDASLQYLNDVEFSVNKDSLDFQTQERDDLIFVYEDEKVKVVKKLTFDKSSYIVDYSIEVLPKSNVDKSFVISVGPGLEGEKQSYDFFDYDRVVTFINEKKESFYKEDITKETRSEGTVNWISVCNKYFASVILPLSGASSVKTVSNIEGESELLFGGLEYPSNEAASVKARLYFGPQDSKEMAKLDPSMDYIKDYGIFSFIAMPLFTALSFFHEYFANWGWAIIVLTIIIKILFYPLTRSSFRSMAKMRELSPQLKILQERYKDDRQKLSQEMMNLYRENKANPMGGCLPMLLQIPIFISLYNVLLVSIEIKGAPFVLWIHDLSEHDPYYITPVIMGLTMFIQQKISPPMGDPLQQKIMLLLPVVFTFLFLQFPAGLVVYWIVNNILTISQQWYIYKKSDMEKAQKASGYVFKTEKNSGNESVQTAEPTKTGSAKKVDRAKKGSGKKRR